MTKAFLAGIGIGAALGLIFAPQAGSKTRAALAKRINKSFQRPGRFASDSDWQLSESEAIAEVLNIAPRSDLMSVEGIGKGTAHRIIHNRPYETKEEVLQEGILPEEILDRVKEQLVDHQRGIA